MRLVERADGTGYYDPNHDFDVKALEYWQAEAARLKSENALLREFVQRVSEWDFDDSSDPDIYEHLLEAEMSRCQSAALNLLARLSDIDEMKEVCDEAR